MNFVICVDTPLGCCWVSVCGSDFEKFLSCYEELVIKEDCEETCGFSRYTENYIYNDYVIATRSWIDED